MTILITRNYMYCWGEVSHILDEHPFKEDPAISTDPPDASQDERPVTIHQHGLNVIVFGGQAKFYTTEPKPGDGDHHHRK